MLAQMLDIDRRHFLYSLASLGIGTQLGCTSAVQNYPSREFELAAIAGRALTATGKPSFAAWTYGENVPGPQQNAVQVDRRCAQTPLVSEISDRNIRQQRSRCKHVSKLRQSLMPTTPKILDLATFETPLAPVADAVGHMRTRQLRTDQ